MSIDTQEEKPKRFANIAASGALQRVLAFSALILMVIIFSFASSSFLTSGNIIGILTATTVVGILALGVTFVIISGGIDLSVGTVMTLSAVMTALFITNLGLPIVIGIIAGVITGTLLGLFNGFIIAKLNIPPFIATLGTLFIARGLALVLSDKAPVYFNDAPEFNSIAMGSIIGQVFPDFPVPNIVIVLFVMAGITAWILNRTTLGRYTYAIGSNEEATRLSGVNVAAWKMAIYALGGAMAGVGGVVLAARLNSAQPSLGFGYELEAIAAAVVGGVSLRGGEGTILGTVIGAFVISTLTNGLRILSVPQEWQIVITGAIVILAVYLDIVRRNRQPGSRSST
jgi:ribose transport system permease protein